MDPAPCPPEMSWPKWCGWWEPKSACVRSPSPFWWQPEQTSGEHVLFHMGQGDGDDEIILRCIDGVLRLSVFDHSLPRQLENGDFTAGEWIYEFDDGLPLVNDTPYHITAHVKGNRPQDLALLVDGIPRGRPKFVTYLTGGMSSADQASLGGVISAPPIGVEETDDFDSRGVLRIGLELVEYVSASGGRFDVNPSGEGQREVYLHDGPGGPLRRTPEVLYAFGGRGARFTESPDHQSGSAVSLYGYAAPLASDIPAASSSLLDALGPFAVARVTTDRSELEPIILPPPPGGGGGFGGSGNNIGDGIPSTMQMIPVLALDGTPLQENVFQQSGGYALIVSFGPDRFRRGNQFIEEDEDGALFGGSELIFYTSYSGGRLNGVTRGHELQGTQIPQAISNATEFLAQRSHVSYWTGGLQTPERGEILIPGSTSMGTFIVPLSISVSNAAGLVTPSVGNQQNDAPQIEMVQIDLDFEDPTQGSTEWVRFNSIVNNRYLVRDDPNILRRISRYFFGGASTESTTEFQVPENRFWFWRDPDQVNQSQDEVILEAREVNYEAVLDIYNEIPANDNRLAFRGVLGTFDCAHTQGAQVLPVSRFFLRGRDPSWARPGRHDQVTLVSFDGVRREDHIINYAWCGLAEGAGGAPRFAHVALREAPATLFSPGSNNGAVNGGQGAAVEEIENISLAGDSQSFTRMLKFPSGELPFEIPEQVFLGADSSGTSSGSGFIDEVRFWRPEDAGPGVEHGQYFLRREMPESSENAFIIASSSLQFPHGRFGRDTLQGHFSSFFPTDGGLVLVDGELIAIGDVNVGKRRGEHQHLGEREGALWHRNPLP